MSEQAYYGYDSVGDEEPPRGKMSGFTSWIGGLVSLGLVAGLGVWGYNLTMRDVTAVPVIRAMVGPMRVAPEDPGGAITAYQGMAVNRVQADGGVGAVPDRVVLAPDPLALSGEDVPEANLRPRVRSAKLATPPENVRDVSATEPTMVTDVQAAIDAAVREAVSPPAANARAVRNVARLPGVKRSPRPRARVLVASLGPLAPDGPMPPKPTADSQLDVDPSSVVSGTRMVQLGAFDDRTAAIEEWNAVVGRHGDLVGARKRFIQVAESGGRKFYRLRMVGFTSLADSRRLCSALLARGTPCIPVTAR